jgi:hypothetical protein
MGPACVAALLSGCGPHHGGGSGGEAGDGASAGTTSAGGGGASAGGSVAGGSAGNEVGGSVAGSGVAGSSGSGGTGGAPLADYVIGCAASAWPEAGWFFEPPPPDEFSTREDWLLARMDAFGISGDGQLVVGSTSDAPIRELAVAWSRAGGIVELPPVMMDNGNCCFEARGVQASCDGSVILQQDSPFSEIYRTEGGQAPVVLYGAPFASVVSMNPDASVIVDGVGQQGEFGGSPLRWTAATGMADVSSLFLESVYGVAPDGTLIAGNADALFEYDVATDVRTPIGMAAVEFLVSSRHEPSIKVSASGKAWAQSADLSYDSFLLWRAGAEPRSVTCPARCRLVDISGTGEVVLVDLFSGSSSSSSIWTLRGGFVDLATIFEQNGIDLAGRKLRAVAMSDDGRAVTGGSFDPSSSFTTERFFYAVLPASIYQ